jgi:rRNA processing protein Krr1/Pno1
MLKLHKDAIGEIKSAQQRVKKAQEEQDKLKLKLKKAQARVAVEKERLRKSQEKLES